MIKHEGAFYVPAFRGRPKPPDGLPSPQDLIQQMQRKKVSPGFIRGILKLVARDLKAIGAEFVDGAADRYFHVSVADEAGDLVIAPSDDLSRIMVEWVGQDGQLRLLGEMDIDQQANLKTITAFIHRTLDRGGRYLLQKVPEDLTQFEAPRDSD